ncbi:RNA-binding domain-containing protein [Okeania sp. SIO2B9]|uniref:RNA-binding domain-containing protein n=1 Tax=Okeania sp. SIO2B9 TaxID=2607782 RepID=UPI001429BB41|nr:RNA-binding domain-containing protein [Okeania sp. SIO2B9]NES91131.1 hypothetical protein [Okeania sp. SIO2B9]
MPAPKEVFDNPEKYWSFITSPTAEEFEGQYFDRKEVGRPQPNGCMSKNELNKVVEQITKCISAFANSNKEGGLLVLGISDKGDLMGVNHLNEEQINRLTNIDKLLKYQSASIRFYSPKGETKKICLIYTPYTENGICETPGDPPKSWERRGSQSIPLNHDQRDRLRRDKKIVNFERQYCSPYDADDLEKGVLNEFRPVFLDVAKYDYSDDELLYQAGALIKDGNNYAFTNAGFLFFVANPQRIMPSSYIRLLRFEVNNEDRDNRGLPTFEKEFTGSITKQIRDIRTFLKESGFFKLYQKRNPDGGFSEEPEYPYIAIDEAIVNAVAHRDYAIQLPIECELYKDAFVVKNGGRILQRDQQVPHEFRLDDKIILNSMPRNPKLIKWLKIMREKGGAAFIRALSEGTKRMRDEMKKLNLPAPLYIVNPAETTLILYSNSAEREANFSADSGLGATNKFSNLFPLKFIMENGEIPDGNFLNQRSKDIISALKNALIANGWYIDTHTNYRLVAHRKNAHIRQNKKVDEIVRFYQVYLFQIRQYSNNLNNLYLRIDLDLQVRNVQNISKLFRDYPANFFANQRALARWQENWYHGKIIRADSEYTNLYIFDLKKEVQVPSNRVIPNLQDSTIEEILNKRKIKFNLSTKIEELSLENKHDAAEIRAEKIQAIAKYLSQDIFKPLIIGGMQIFMEPSPTSLSKSNRAGN